MKLLNKSFYTVLIITLFTLVSSGLVRAEIVHKNDSLKTIAFLFHKMIDTPPDFDVWTEITTKATINSYGELGRRDYLSKVRSKLMLEYESLYVENTTFKIDYTAILEALPIKGESGEDSEYFLHTYFKKSPPFIIVEIPGYKINLVIPDIENKVKMVVSKEEYEEFKNRFYDSRILKKNNIYLNLSLKPVQADGKNPLLIGDDSFYLMQADLIDFEIKNDINTVVLWPLPPSEEDVKALKEEEAKDDFFNKYQ